MRTIHRYALKIADEQIIEMPHGAEIISIARRDRTFASHIVQRGGHDAIEMWAIVEDTAPMVNRIVIMRGTGHPLPDAATADRHVATVQVNNGKLIFHVFVVEES